MSSPARSAVGSAVMGPTSVPLRTGVASGGGGGQAERVVSWDFSATTGWSPAIGAWTIAAGIATNNTSMQYLTGTLSPPLVGDELFPVVLQKLANPAGTTMIVQLFNSVTSAAQLIYNDIPPGGAGAGTVTIPDVTASGAFDRIRFRSLDDAGLVFDSVSLIA